MVEDKHIGLAEKATCLKKAWLVAVAFIGADGKISEQELRIPNYILLENNWLKRHIKDLEADFYDLSRHILSDFKKSNMSSVIKWFSSQHDEWMKTQSNYYDMGRVHEFEEVWGRFAFRDVMECPPYAQILLQGLHGAAIRYPEYHLAKDLALQYNLFLDSETIINNEAAQGRSHCSEHNQSLGRSVILTCYNLLESFTSGLAAAYLLDNSDAPEDAVKKLKQNRDGLSKRFRTFPILVTGRDSGMSIDKEPLKSLFGTCQQRRNSFVHCEPGPEPSKYGYIKEFNFHDVTLANVKETVDLAEEAICMSWKHVHGKERPHWLPCREADGRFPRIEVSLRLGGLNVD
jgi:hypothetical protein